MVESVADGDTVTINGQPRHVLGYLAEVPVSSRTGLLTRQGALGWKNGTACCWRAFSPSPANVLVLDQPTNDLDIETLELLEELLDTFDGTVLLVTHDREFLDNVVTSTFAFEGDGRVVEYVGGWQDYLRQAPQPAPSPDWVRRPAESAALRGEASGRRKKTFREEREYAALPRRIEALEGEQKRLQEEAAGPEFYRAPADRIQVVLARIDGLHHELEEALARWVELEEIGR